MHTRGACNAELVERIDQAMEVVLKDLAGAPWGLLATVSEEAMHTPESYAAMVAEIRKQRQTGRCATALIFDHVFGEAVVRTVLVDMYRDAGEPAQFFPDEASGKRWLLERIAEAEAAAASG